MATHSVILPEKYNGQGAMVAYSPWGRKESDTTARTHTHIKAFHGWLEWHLAVR